MTGMARIALMPPSMDIHGWWFKLPRCQLGELSFLRETVRRSRQNRARPAARGLSGTPHRLSHQDRRSGTRSIFAPARPSFGFLRLPPTGRGDAAPDRRVHRFAELRWSGAQSTLCDADSPRHSGSKRLAAEMFALGTHARNDMSSRIPYIRRHLGDTAAGQWDRSWADDRTGGSAGGYTPSGLKRAEQGPCRPPACAAAQSLAHTPVV